VSIWQSLIITAAEVYEPNDGWGLAGLVVIGLPSIITAVIGGIILVRQHRADKKIDAVKSGVEATTSQVVNDHEDQPVLRVDLDEKFAGVHQAIAGVKTAVLVEQTTRKTAIDAVVERLESIEGHLRGR
jgi:hypothetical protein